jgi:hypothetical protein
MAYFNKHNITEFGDQKPEKVFKEKKAYKFKKEPTGEAQVFKMIWNERPHKSQISGAPIKEATPTNFLHVLPKAQNKYPEFKLLKQNIILGTAEEHHIWDNARHLAVGKQWAKMFELEETLKNKYKELHGTV